MKRNERRQLFVEQLEARNLLDANYSFEVIGTSFFLRLDGDPTLKNEVTLQKGNTLGSIAFTITFDEDGNGTVDPDEGILEEEITTTDIHLEQLANPGKTFKGVHVVTGNQDDTITTLPSLTYSVWAQAGDGDDTIQGGIKADFLEGQGGNDTINGGAGADIIKGGTGDDTIDGEAGADQLFGDEGNDVVNAQYADTVIDGGTGGESLINPNSNGDLGDHLFFTGPGGSYTNTTFEVVDGTTGADIIDSTNFVQGGDWVGTNNGVIIHGNGGSDTLTGSNHADTITGDAGDDTIEGKGDSGGAGDLSDSLDGGTGIDTVSYEHSPDGVVIDLTLNTADENDTNANDSDALRDSITGFENVRGSAFDDILTGNAVANKLEGLGGADTLEGRGGKDKLLGGAGDDSLDGGAGDDELYGEAGNDTLEGGLGADFLNGGLGNDDLNGGAGIDTLFVDPTELNPNDSFTGGAGKDIFKYGTVFNATNYFSVLTYLLTQKNAGLSDFTLTPPNPDTLEPPL